MAKNLNVCVWLEEDTLKAMDRHIKDKNYASRSHFLRTLVKRELEQNERDKR